MKNLILLHVSVATGIFILAAPTMAGPHFLPRVRLPKINGRKVVGTLTHPITQTLVAGGRTILKVGAAADAVGLVPNVGPPAVSHVAKKTLWGIGNH